MAGPGGVEVGRAALVVLPDLSKFTASLRKFVERIERQVVIELPTVLDTRGVTEDIEKLKERIRHSPAEVPVSPTDLDEFARKVRADVHAATRTLQAQVPVTADGGRLRRDVAAQVEAIERMLSVDVPMDPSETARFRRQVLDQVALVQAQVRANPVRVPVTYNRSGLDQLQTALSRIAANGGGSRGLSFRAKLYTAIGLAAAFAAPNVLSLAGGLAQVAGVSALLPGILTATAVGIGTLVIGFEGFGKAMKALSKGQAEKFQEALKNLAPAARETALAIRDLRKPFKDLRLKVQQQLFAGVARQLQKLSRTYLPVLTKGLGQVASAFNSIFKQLSAGFMDRRTVADVRSIFADIADSLKRMGPGLRALTRAFISMSQVGADMLPGLADGFTNAMNRFDAFIDRVRKNGDLRKFIQSGLDAVRDVGSVLLNAGKILGGLISAAQAAGAGGLRSLAEGMERIADVVNSPGFQRGLTIVFDGLHDGLKAITDSFPAIGRAFSALAPGIADFARAFGTGLGQLLTNIADALVVMAPTINELANGLSKMNPHWLALGLAVVPIWGILSKLAPLLAALPRIFSALASPVALVVAAIAAVVAGFVLLYQNSQPVRDAFAGIIHAAQDLWTTVQPIVTQIAQIVQENWPQIQATAQAVFGAVEQIVVLVLTNIRIQIQVTTAIITALWSVFGDTILAVTRVVFPAILAVITNVMNTISAVIRAVLAALKGDWSGAWEQLKVALGTAWDAMVAMVRGRVEAVRAVVTTLGPKILDALGDFSTLLVNAGKSLIQGLIDGIRSKFADIGRVMGEVAQKIKDHLPGSPVKTGPLTSWNDGAAGKRLVELLAQGLRDTGPVDRAISSLSSSLAGVLPTPPELAGAAGGISRSVNVTANGPGAAEIAREVIKAQRRDDALHPVYH